jgi:hypothetical protein
MPARPDFSFPCPDVWRTRYVQRIGEISKALMVYRPLVLNNLFHCEQRCPTSRPTRALREHPRQTTTWSAWPISATTASTSLGQRCQRTPSFITANCRSKNSLGLYAEADLAFTCAGFAPVLAQAVGTRTVIVYGGHEGFRTTNSGRCALGSRRLPSKPINQCECHGGHYTRGPNGELVKPSRTHECDKTIDLDSRRCVAAEFRGAGTCRRLRSPP